jgi:DNA processing protein
MKQVSIYDIAVGLIPGIGGALTRQLVSYCGSSENIFKQPKGKLKRIPGIGEVLAETIINQNILKEAENELKLAEKYNTQILFYTDQNYPERLKHINDAPALLYYKGNADLNARKIIGIVGTRQATDYGKETVQKILSDLIKHNVLVISGLAYGIDIAAHKAALTNDQQTVGVMASGIDIIYPAAHKDIAMKMLEKGGLITENKFGSKPDAPKFPARNRIIAGMCDAIIVAEAAEKGGALITADLANGYDREVFAVPGNLGLKFSDGCNKLIKQHKAHIYTDISDLEYIMNWDSDDKSYKEKEPSIDLSALNKEEKEIIKILIGTDGMQMDDLSWKLQIPISKMASTLLNLEFQGLIKGLPGKKFKLN